MAKQKIEPAAVPEKRMYVTWEKGDERAKAIALSQVGDSLRRVEPVLRTQASEIFRDIAPGNISIRDGFSRDDYEPFRWDERVPKRPKDILLQCMKAYDQIGIVRNVIDLMADFGSQGISLIHPNPRIENWWQEWFRRVNGKERSERFLNMLYRTGNVIIKRMTAKISVKVEDQMRRAQGEADIEVADDPKLERREIPWKYVFFNPLSIEVMGDELATFVGQDTYAFAVRIPGTLVKKVRVPKDATEKELVSMIPPQVQRLILSGRKSVPLDPKKTMSFYYKKDDWEVWARPMIYPILADLLMLQKMKLADLAALDGAISCIRVWKLGDIENGILPTDVAINRLAEMLMNNVGGGVMDLVWGPEINLVETSTEVYRFLGQTKYEPVLTAIYAGLGVPPTLTGASTQSGFTNNYISLKTLTERLQYGRDALTAFWQNEIRITQKQMGFRFPAKVTYDHISFTDENAEKALLIQLFDRSAISLEALQDRFGEDPEIEAVRIRREQKQRLSGSAPPKAGPFHAANTKDEITKQFVQHGVVTPSQVGLDLPEPKDGEKTPMQQKRAGKQGKPVPVVPPVPDANDTDANPKGEPGEGRPLNSKDTLPRKQRVANPRTSASAAFFETLTRVQNTQGKLAQLVTPALLKVVGKKTLRELTEAEATDFEEFKFALLSRFSIDDEVNEQTVAGFLKGPLVVPENAQKLVRATVARHVQTTGREPSVEVMRQFQACACALYWGDFTGEAGDSDDGLPPVSRA